MDADAPAEILERMQLRQRMLEGARGPFARFTLKRLLGDRDDRGIIRLLQERFRPKDVAAQQAKVARAQALAFIAPVYFMGFPAILKGWIERVFTLGLRLRAHARGLERRHPRPGAAPPAREGPDHADHDLRRGRLPGGVRRRR